MKRMIGLDVGTSFLIASIKKNKTEVYNSQRDCYFVIPESNQKAISIAESSGAHFIRNQDKEEYYLIGESAIQFANLLNTFMNKEEVDNNKEIQLKRPMSQGVLNPKDKLGSQMLEILIGGVIEGVVDEVLAQNEGIVYYSVPANPVDGDFNTIFHASRIEQKLESLGYIPNQLNEGLAVVYSEAPSVTVGDETIVGEETIVVGKHEFTTGFHDTIEKALKQYTSIDYLDGFWTYKKYESFQYGQLNWTHKAENNIVYMKKQLGIQQETLKRLKKSIKDAEAKMKIIEENALEFMKGTK